MTSPEPANALDPEEILAHTDWLRALARRLVGGADADDLAQEAQIRALRARTPVRNLKAYLGQTLRNVASRRSARETLRRDREALVASEREAAEPSQDPADERVELLEVCLHRLRSLPEAQRRAVTLRYLDGLSFEEIADREGVKAATVRSNVSRGIEALRLQLDEHAGSRARWCMAIGPWAMGDFGAAGATALESFVPHHFEGGSQRGPAGAAIGAGALALMLKPTTLALAGVAAGLAGWITLKSGEPEGRPEREVAAQGRGTNPEPVESNGAESIGGPGVLVPDGPGERAPVGTIPAPALGAPLPVEGRVIDALTGEPVPGVRVEVERGEDSIDGGGTDLDGRFRADGASMAAGEVNLMTYDAFVAFEPSRLRQPRPPMPFPFDGPISMAVGPTFTPRFTDVRSPEGTRFDVEARGPGIPVNRPLKATYPRADRRSWIRFSEPFVGPEGDSEGEWALTFRSRDGFWVGEARATRGYGVEATPLDVAVEHRGSLRLVIQDGSAVSATTMVTLTSEVLATPLSVWMSDADDRAGPSVGSRDETPGDVTVTHLKPGPYRWSMGSGLSQASGDVVVVAGRVTNVTLAPTVDAAPIAIPVNASAVPDADLSKWPVQFFCPEDVSKVFKSHLERAPGGGGQWVVPVDSLPEGEWKMAVAAPEGYVAVPLAVDVKEALAGSAVMEIRATVSTQVTLTVTSSAAGFRGAWVHHLDGVVTKRLKAGEDGTFVASVPSDRPSTFLVASDGFNLTSLTYEPGRDPRALEVELEPGHRTRAWVIDVESLAPLEGIEILVEGQSVGKTDALGNVWFDAESAPSTIEIGPASKAGLREMMTPSTPGYGVSVGDLGYVFMVARGK